MNRNVVLLVALIAGTPVVALNGQRSSEQKPLAFEVASVKQVADVDEQQRGIQPIQPGGLFRAVGLTVREYLRVAYGSPETLLSDQVTGGPAWVDADRFEIIAKVANPASLPGQVITMLRTLFAERFKLTVHTEARQLQIYDLVLAADDAKLGPRLRHATEACIPFMTAKSAADFSRACGVRRRGAGVLAGVGSMARLAGILSQYAEVSRVVRDRTDLAGDFEFDLEFQGNEQAVGDGRPSLFTALREQLGLKLVSTRGPVDVLVIDHVERPTTD